MTSMHGKGDLENWVRTTLPRALGYARAVLRDQIAAEDVVQDCYVRLIEHADRYDLLQDGLKILLRSVFHACLDRVTRERSLLSLDDTPNGAHEICDRSSPDPPQEAMAHELSDRIEQALARLPVGQRAAVHLAALGYSLPEVAEIMGTTHGNARVLVHRARKSLEAELESFLMGGET